VLQVPTPAGALRFERRNVRREVKVGM